MAEGWKQLIEDLRSALGVKSSGSPSSSESKQPEALDREILPGLTLENSIRPTSQLSEEIEPIEDLEPSSPSPTRRLFAALGVAAALVLAVGFFWVVYFGDPKPPAPDVVATFNGGQITIPQVQEHLALLAPEAETAFKPSYENYQALVQHMLLNELVRRWAAEQKVALNDQFKDAMRHISESVTLDDWIASLHQDEMLSSVSESDIQSYYENNRGTFSNATLAEVRDQIRQTLAHQNQERFFEDYLERLRSEATIIKDYELLAAPPPTNEQLRQYYTDNAEQFRIPQRALVDRIFVPFEGQGEEAESQAQARSAEARAALQAGKSFAEVAEQYSQEPYNSAGVFIENGKEDAEVVKAAFALSQAGDLSSVLRAQKGYYVLQLREQQTERQLSFEDARSQVDQAVQANNEKRWFEENAERTLFSIHGERFTLGQFYHEYQNLPSQLQAQFSTPEDMKQLADILIDRMLLLDDAYNKLVDQENAPLLEEARTALLREMIHEQEFNSRGQVTDEDIKKVYDSQKEHFKTPPEARIQSIQIYLGETEDDRKRAFKRAEEAYHKLVPGPLGTPADFDQVAKEYDESDQAPADSQLGTWIRMGDDPVRDLFDHPLHEYINAMPLNQLSEPFEYGQNIYIVRVLERVESKPMDLEEVKDHIRSDLEAQQHEKIDAEIATRLLKEANAKIYSDTIQKLVGSEQATPAP